MVKHYSNNIQNVIQRELFTANSSIKIAVAWFTNDLLFQPLLLKLATGVKVDLILNKDEINLSSSIDFNLFAQQGGNLYWNESDRLMHEKFCIIDDRVVITGSYNWTNKAEVNYESISVFTDEQDTITDYKARFQSISRNFVRQTPQVKPQPIVKSGKCPASLQPYTKLKFYHSIKLFESSNTPILANQYEGGPYALLDSKTFLPRTQFMFSNYSSFIPDHNYLWLKGETKWGLFDCDKLEFVVKPQFDSVDNQYSKGIIVKINGRLGLYSYSGKEILPCAYTEIKEYPYYFIMKLADHYEILWTSSMQVIAQSFDAIIQCYKKAIIVKKDNYLGLVKDGSMQVACKYDDIKNLDDAENVFLLESHNKFVVFDRCMIISKDKFDNIVYKKDHLGNEFLILEQNQHGVLRYGAYIINQAQNSQRCQTRELFYTSRVYACDSLNLYECHYSNITYSEICGYGCLHFQKEYYSKESCPQDQHSLYIMGRRVMLGGLEKWYSKIKYGSRYDIDIILLYVGMQCRVYLLRQDYELRGSYDKVVIYNGALGLMKNGKHGAYLIQSHKYIDCKYDKILFNPWDGVLCFSNDNTSDEDIKIQL